MQPLSFLPKLNEPMLFLKLKKKKKNRNLFFRFERYVEFDFS